LAQLDALLFESLPGGLDQDGSAIFEHLISGKTEAQFTNEMFEKSPVYFKRGGAKETQNSKKRKAETPTSDVFSKAKLLEVSSEHKLSKSNNVTMTKYVSLKRVDRKETKTLFMTKDDVQKAFNEGFTLQFYQPQRFVDSLAKINWSLEYTFQTLAGASAYLTPPNSQGLEPHHDDVEVFILQTEGSKRWRLYLQNCPILPDTYAKNLNASQLGEPTEVFLDKGDMLYLPRGAIHEAVTEDKFSTHVTFSIYQHNNYKSLLNRLFPKLTDALFANSQQLRCGLPIRIQEIFGTLTSGKTDGSKTKSTNIRATELEKIQKLVQEISNSISSTPLSELTLERAMDETVDEIVADFVENRLPPPFENVASSISGDRLRRFLDGRLVHAQIEQGESGEEEIALYSSFGNDRRRHMNHPVDDDDDDDDDDNDEDDEMHTARFPIRFAPLIAALRASSFIHETKIIDAVAGLGITSSEVKATIEMLGIKGFLCNT